MHIIVCIKQVPDTQKVKVDPATGVLLRSGVDSKMNPYDLYAIETALRLKKLLSAQVTALSMGPMSAKEVLYEAMAMGVDDGVLMSDRKFGGADVKATSYTLSQGILAIDPQFSLIICGRQTTDGDTAQVGPSISKHLGIPHISWVAKIREVSRQGITVDQNLPEMILTSQVSFPCLITVEKDIYQPRLPSYRLQQASKDEAIRVITHDDLSDGNINHYGLAGSATQVERIFEPAGSQDNERYDYGPAKNARLMYEKLVDHKFLEER